MTADSLAEYLSGRGINVTTRSGEFWAQCPAHADPTPSLSWSDGADAIKMRCKAGCQTSAVLLAWGLPWAILFHDETPPAREREEPPSRKLPTPEELAASADRLAGDAVKLAQLAEWRGWTDPGKLKALGVGETTRGRVLFPCRDGTGALVGVTEYEPNPTRKGPKSISTGKRDMFPAPEFTRAGEVYVVEGEGDAITGLTLGLNAVGVPGAAYWAGARGKEAARRLSDRPRVYFLPDCDDAGREWMKRAADDCAALGIDVRVLELNGTATNGYDLTDLVAEGGAEPARKYVESLARKSSRLSAETAAPSPSEGYPRGLPEEAFIGLSARIARAFEPVTEADTAAILLQLLTAFGSMVGREPYMILDGARHYPVLFVCIVGRSSKARKGTAWARVAEVMERSNRTWFEDRVVGGLSSGEGLIWEVRDPVYERARKDGKRVDEDAGDYEDGDDRYVNKVVDPGVDDKRLLVVESEFAQTLRVMRREGNTLSMNLRNLWDRGTGGGMTKGSKTRTRNAHVSIIGHITVEELRREMGMIDLYNGFANRFLFGCVKRSKLLPGGGAVDDLRLDEFAHELATAAEWARQAGRVTMDVDAERLWVSAYTGELAVEHGGAYGAVTARGEAMVARVAMLYALLDGSAVIRPTHMRAALAVWRFCDASARFLFGTDAVLPPDAQRMREVLSAGPADGMTRTDINTALRRNWKAERIEAALEALRDAGLAVVTVEDTGGVRPAERWRLT